MALKEPIITTYRKEPVSHEIQEDNSVKWHEESLPGKMIDSTNLSNPIEIFVVNEKGEKGYSEKNFKRFFGMFLDTITKSNNVKEITNIEQSGVKVYSKKDNQEFGSENCIKNFDLKVVYNDSRNILLKFILTTFTQVKINFLLRYKMIENESYVVTDIVPQGNYIIRLVYLRFYAIAKKVIQEMRLFLEVGNPLPMTLSELD